MNGSVLTGGILAQKISGNTNYLYWDIETSQVDTSVSGEGKTTIEMKQQATYTGWDFNEVWSIDEGVDYPRLQWENN